MTDEPTPDQEPQPQSAREAKADVKAAKAREKAMRPWYKKKRFLLPLGLLALIIIIAVATSGGGDGDTDTAGTNGEAPQDQSGGEGEGGGEEPAAEIELGQSARDGQFEFTVNSFECGETAVGDEFFREEAQGQYCLLDVRVENIGDQAQYLFADNQYLFDEEGRQFSADSEATFALDPEGEGLFTEINPGNSIEGTIVFDVPENASIVRARLHDSALSGGVEVDL